MIKIRSCALIHFAKVAAAADDIILSGTYANELAPQLVSIGDGGLLSMWEGCSTRGGQVEVNFNCQNGSIAGSRNR
ncbi:hypothetical protein PHPALM_28170 [Phytophthora palmivora]|uniref:Uncharacterized protein n=1 Tax=Phytophthora palmivora TaxID=4796 RepID=A0A2P4XAU6_9STRA|nr:hypothetical protein PHPALM_28170 [Phytophthora palmivora]